VLLNKEADRTLSHSPPLFVVCGYYLSSQHFIQQHPVSPPVYWFTIRLVENNLQINTTNCIVYIWNGRELEETITGKIAQNSMRVKHYILSEGI